MAHSTLIMQLPQGGELVHAPVGLSWTSLVFGFFVPLYRSNWGMAVIALLLTVILGPLPNLIMWVVYNKWYINHMIKRGYVIIGYQSERTAAELSYDLGIAIPKQTLMG